MTGAIFVQLFLDAGPLVAVYFSVIALIVVFLKVTRRPPEPKL